ncbi:toll/interleukin-1 receptor domain-containing protein [Sinorhizobium medicae]|uniref:toll/interleukin-1 receptor domain-containing protein n=1 Tax=Sinorhizobium medicae TaxID=110321 RepID=UPI002AF6CDB5|nr:toll/interleukin-1 receptor domain-containing protein [Sinorhizobium medicae]WQO48663.1 toll/interleukin-1 receptor domain-containing protein [Sinorhizobium medicae]WQO68911.1 toll/interleukin-1 receptor domain-containing protein [Sinorhizobium medicae]WQO77586.1 toll/interleukin-1 receptor domain-containing protein [Sinorhizobium medicae]
MPFITESQVRNKVADISPVFHKLFLAVHAATSVLRDTFDIFLSHSTGDAEIILGVRRILEETGKTVYIDWIDDPDLERGSVSGETAQALRKRMRQCSSLLYVYSQSSQKSRWMPWELGYFDGINGNVAVLPVIPDSGDLDFEKEEYLQLYPKIDFINITSEPRMFVNQSQKLESGTYKSFDDWRSGEDKLRPV